MNSSLSRALLSRALAFSGTSWEQSMFGYGIKATNQCQLIDQLSQRGFVQNPSLIAAMKRVRCVCELYVPQWGIPMPARCRTSIRQITYSSD